MAYLGEEIKKLGFGLMRLPRLSDETIDLEQVKQMVDLFLSKGFTYFDTAWAYPGSEDAIRQALVERYPREKFQLATKNAAWINCKTQEDAIAQFETSLRQTGAGYFDFYLLHNLGEHRTEFFERFKMWDFVFEKKREGLIKHVGFSFHSTPEELDELLTKHPEAEFVQLQINWADWENPAIQSRGCYEVARKHGKPLVIMEPIKGGMLANPPDEVKAVFQKANPNASIASWAIRFAASLDGVIAVLSGMSTLEQMQDNVSYMEDFKRLDDTERATVDEARKTLAGIPIIPCTVCNYCAKVCPVGVGISGSFTAMNILTLYKDKTFANGQYEWLVARHDKKYASECIKCGACEGVCPQHIKIRGELVKVAKAFGK
ncbi:MAG: aldo/keto reductase [Selenomonadaceae bacterium]|nr:aldo/keto reductase [Selenomonadaceae bacterium]